MRIAIKILIIFFLISDNAFPQAVTWQRLYNSYYDDYESGRDICLTSDGNFIIVGLIYVGSNIQAIALKINPFGDTLWMRIIENFSIHGAYCCAPTNDGGCVFTGDAITNFAVRLNSDGSTKWTKFYGTTGLINNDIKTDLNGGFVFCGRNINLVGYITRIDSLGNLDWEKPFPSGFSKTFSSLVKGIDNGFVVSGTVKDNKLDTEKGLIMKINSEGVLQWEKRYLIQNQGASILESDVLENGYLFGGTSTDTIKKLQGSSFIAKTDLYGNLTFSKIFYTSNQEYFYDIKNINESKYVMAVRQTFLPEVREDNAKLYILDSEWNIINEKIFINKFFSAFRVVLPLSNHDILAVGIYEFGFLFGQRDIYAVRTDSILNSPPLSINTISSNTPDIFNLHQNFPNPFNSTTEIVFDITTSAFVSLKIYDINGKEISTLVYKYLTPNNYKVIFSSQNFSTSIYFYQIVVNGVFIETKKMIFLK